MSQGRLMSAWINPLAFLEVDEPWAPKDKMAPTAESILSFLCPPGVPADSASLIERYKRISTEPDRLFAAPGESMSRKGT